MRFQEWDVLLFPQSSGVPVQEFKTECFAIRDELGLTPTVNTFVPSMARGVPFQVSIHSWSPPTFTSNVGSHGGMLAWAARVMIDGVFVASETFTHGVIWPQVIGAGLRNGNAQAASQTLSFPLFRRSILGQTRLNIGDYQGRIKVILSEGVLVRDHGKNRFRPTKHIVCFTFVHAPMSLLQNCGIAWPNPRIFGGIYASQHAVQQPFSQVQLQPHLMPNPSLFFDFTQQTQDFASQASTLSNASTSTLAPSVPGWYGNDTFDMQNFGNANGFLPPLYDYGSLSNPLHSAVPVVGDVKQQQLQVRLPSDQIQEIVNAVSPKKSTQAAENGVSMADIESQSSSHMSFMTSRNQSDISMHVACTQFPTCVVDTPVGVAHKPRPVSVVPQDPAPKSRKRNSNALGDLKDMDGNRDHTRKVSKTENMVFSSSVPDNSFNCSIL